MSKNYLTTKRDGELNIKKVYRTVLGGSLKDFAIVIDTILKNLEKIFVDLDDCTHFEIKVILNELLVNAIKHGSNFDPDKNIRIASAIVNYKYFFLIIEDEGSGYCYDKIYIQDEECKIDNMLECGRGLIIVKSLCDRIKLNKKGNKIYILKKLQVIERD